MNLMDQYRVRKIIRQVAAKEGVSVEAVRQQMQIAIQEAFEKRYEPGNVAFIRQFGDRCPSVEEFILTAAASVDAPEDHASVSLEQGD